MTYTDPDSGIEFASYDDYERQRREYESPVSASASEREREEEGFHCHRGFTVGCSYPACSCPRKQVMSASQERRALAQSSKAGGQEREARIAAIRWAVESPKGGWMSEPQAKADVRFLLAALDAERSRAEQWERDAKTNGEMYQGEYERHQQTKACIRELEAALREIGQHPARYGIDASDFALLLLDRMIAVTE